MNITVESGAISLQTTTGPPVEREDQSQSSYDGSFYVFGNRMFSEIFTPSLTGNLTKVMLGFRRYGNPPAMVVQIRDTSGGHPGTTILATAQRSDIATGSFQDYEFTFSNPPRLTAGTEYAITAFVQGFGGSYWNNYRILEEYQWPTAPYPGLMYYSNNAGGWWWAYNYYDLYFTTYILAPPVYEHGMSVVQKDAGQIIDWDLFNSSYIEPVNTDVSFEFRTSNDSVVWSDWFSDISNTLDGRYIEQRIIMTSDGSASPSVDWTTMASSMNEPFTSDVVAYRSVVNSLTASGGADLPESHLRAINESIALGYRTDVNRFNIMITDAAPHAIDCGNDLACNLGPKYVMDMTDDLIANDISFYYINKASGLCSNRIMADNMTNLTGGEYYEYTESEGVQDILLDIASQIVNVSFQSQTAVAAGNFTGMIVYPDSYIEYQYNPDNMSTYGEISITQWSEAFNNNDTCEGIVPIPDGVVISDLKVTSYSSDHWTDYLRIDNSQESEETFKLYSDFGGDYSELGDPFVVNVPAEYVVEGENNTITIETGDNETSRAGCSLDDRAIYTMRVSGLVGYSNIHTTSMGCEWTLEFEDSSTFTADIPSYYNESDRCYYTTSNITFDESDAVDDAVYRLLTNLDVDDDSQIDLLFDPAMIDFELASAGGVQSLWGPAKFKLILWI